MGIKGLYNFIKKRCFNAIRSVNIEEYRGKTIAVDVNIYLYIFKRKGDKWLCKFKKFIAILKSYDIKIILIYDNKFPKEKNIRYAQKNIERKMVNNSIAEIETDLREYKENGTVSASLQKIAGKRRSNNYEAAAEQELGKLRNQQIHISKHEIDETKKIALELGIDVIIPEFEAETLCSELCIKGEVDAVLSNDTDVFAYGTPICLMNMKIKNNMCFVDEISYSKILKILNLSRNEFRDFCILCGCDYNEKIRNIASERSYALIRKFHSLESIESNTKLPTNQLNYVRVRKLFTPNFDATYQILNQ